VAGAVRALGGERAEPASDVRAAALEGALHGVPAHGARDDPPQGEREGRGGLRAPRLATRPVDDVAAAAVLRPLPQPAGDDRLMGRFGGPHPLALGLDEVGLAVTEARVPDVAQALAAAGPGPHQVPGVAAVGRMPSTVECAQRPTRGRSSTLGRACSGVGTPSASSQAQILRTPCPAACARRSPGRSPPPSVRPRAGGAVRPRGPSQASDAARRSASTCSRRGRGRPASSGRRCGPSPWSRWRP
jgi:hypothetical protein